MTVIANQPAGATGAAPPTAPAAAAKSGFAALGSGDFLRLMIEQLKQQDPTNPVDNKEMLVQMAQFTALSGTTETNATLQAIADKLDSLVAAQSSLQDMLRPGASA
ncbi:flagellar biosynthesis protein FlgD [Erythrobacter sp. 3-20A1M]|uniref:flagellar hook assembly protein FlgD n=1 Tax=Erythrobacter sp. 3-20A1M TaxID=2653850 RepID=UPI001BFC19FE|nr:flagellar hook capping FlgD N-terminal domain-containing protein [Erythrobacter sp. 3-20A1M]QWC57417.1 flagellar biosynthesis protein FlgD [Erythrobacter sp. 3-20A1M]